MDSRSLHSVQFKVNTSSLLRIRYPTVIGTSRAGMRVHWGSSNCRISAANMFRISTRTASITVAVRFFST